MTRKQFVHFFSLAVVALAIAGAAANAAIIPVPNGDFETAPPDPNGDGDNNPTTGDVSPPWNGDNNYLESTNEAFTNPSNFVLGWQSNGPAGENAKYGLQQPRSGTGTNQLYYQRTQPAGTLPTGTLTGAFNGNLIGFTNMDDADGFDQEFQSGILGNLQPGNLYILKVAVGARANQNWNDIRYQIMLVGNPTAGGPGPNDHGSSGGAILGTPTTAILQVLGTAPDTTNIQDLTYMFTAATSDPFAIRITTQNTQTQNGIPDPTAPAQGGTNARFTQGNFDNVRLEVVPEPGAILLLSLATVLLGLRRRSA